MKSFQYGRSTSPAYRAARIFRTNAVLIDLLVKPLGLCYGQVPYVLAITEQEGQTQDELATTFRVNRAATARTLKTMEEAGLITRNVNPDNQRQKLVYSTAKSRAMLDDLFDILNTYNARMLGGFSPEESTQLLALMDRVIDNVEQMLEQSEADNALC